MKHCVVIGLNAGWDLKDDSEYLVRIGNFTDKEVKERKFTDCYIFDDGRVIIKKSIVDKIFEEKKGD